MARKTRVKDQEELELELTPMIDIVFNLLIFFMVATKFKTTEGMIKAFLPKNRGQGSGTPTIDLNEVRIKCLWYDSSGRATDAEQGYCVIKVGDENFNSPGELESAPTVEKSPVWRALHDKLSAFKTGYKGGGENGLPVIIDSRKQVPTKYVILVLNEVVRAEIKDVTFAAPEIDY
jgi:biopolymer transport protein ExbD